ncbi:pyruvate dehydrogenase (acetyl-transferring) E1 component subunit alpha [Quadrisphaera sp. DSM 44207]|uniref:pyruvate dehydrogenase (acetyl-transferring) E1 component subunit alpha n=1 Tax=Quadrisphaera sp. DSM 44207 TaxID=1881057 RepID=UPI0008880AA9|nr:pyruvate dehydrogenase (acetyl-transferring) E1 component subunit alpha [Quadrisphaera sp. DSM 44207]SDQ88884.1 pyruvate dehydrogenase E1 component alpha subunit [Quadrisphaera sp. DSM 44207]
MVRSGSPSPGALDAAPAPGAEPMVQLLTPEGERVDDDAHASLVAHLGAEQLRGRYRDMAVVRRFDTEATSLQRQGELALWASCSGQEAAQVGAGRALRPQDHVFPTYREHGVAWTRGLDPVTLLQLYRGTTHGGWDPADANGFHLYTLVIGAQTLHATGYAMGVQRDGAVGTGDPERDTAVLACFGDGASAQGEVNEAFVWAGVFNAPVVFFCQNNQFAISEPNERQMRAPLHQRAAGFGFPGVRVDGNDVLAVEAVVRAAAERARSGEGPTLVEAYTYRMAAHTTSDDTTRYRSSAEEEVWRARDPLARLEAHLRATGGADDAFFAAVRAEADALGERVRRGCRALADPEPASMFEHVYAEQHPLVDEERAWLEQWLDEDGEEAR